MIPKNKSETKQIPNKVSYTIDDMKNMFGKRIANAITYSESNKNKRIYMGLSTKKMIKICKRWKFWNQDIRKAYKNYIGYIHVPWIIQPTETIIMCDNNTIINKKILNKYMVNPKYYEEIKTIKSKQ